jgi:ATP-binding cassette, subfamily B, multidrug efflux pump
VALARAIFSGNPILLLDDPFSAVDIGTERRMIERIRKDLRGTTILIFSHRLAAFAGADRILVLDKGRLVEQGNHAQLMADGGIYEKIYSAQSWMEAESR